MENNICKDSFSVRNILFLLAKQSVSQGETECFKY